jgi:hypothetical protein
MPHSEMHGRWASEPERAELHRHTCAEMLEQIAAGWSAPYPYGDVLYLLEVVRPPADTVAAPSGGVVRRQLGAAWRLLTRSCNRRPMGRPNGEGSGLGGRGTELPDRRVPA